MIQVCLNVILVLMLLFIPQTDDDDNLPITHYGVSLSPRSFEDDDFVNFFSYADEMGDVITWSGDWREFADPDGGAPYVITTLSEQFDYIPLMIPTFFEQDTGELLGALDDEVTFAAIIDFVATTQPQYFGFGVEVNVLWEKSLGDFFTFVALFEDLTTALDEVAPDTQVFTVFQLERMMGLQGGLFGGENNPANAQWALLDDFPSADFFAFTTYPSIIFQDPQNIPEDYYATILEHTDKPIAFTEIGWFTSDEITGWESDAEEQAIFVTEFFAQIDPLTPKLVIWSFMYDQSALPVPFDTMGLRDVEDTPRPAWEIWVENVDDNE